MALDGNERRELYRKMLNDPATQGETRKYSFIDWEKKLLGDEKAIGKLAQFAVNRNWAIDESDFAERYIPEFVAPPTPKPQAAPAPPPVEEEPYVPEPQPLVGSPEYDAQLQAQYGGMAPTLGATFGGVPAAFETKAQKKQEQISPAFKAQQLAFEDVPIAEEQRRAQRQFAKATKKQQQAALMGGPGFEYEQEKKAKERGYVEGAIDQIGAFAEGGKRIAKNILSTAGYYAQMQAATDPMASLPYEKRQEMMQQAGQTMYNNATAAQNTFQNEIAKRNIQTSVLQAIEKGQYNRIPESVLYTIGDAAMQIIPSILTFGGSTYMQTLPQAYKDGVEAIAKEKGISPEQVIASGDDGMIVSQLNSGTQSMLEFAGAGLVSKGIASKGGYKAMRDWLLSQNVNRRLAQGAALLGVGTGEAATEYGQELTGQIGKAAAASSTTKAFLDKLPKELFTPEAKKQRQEAFVGGMVGGLGLAGGGQAIQSAMDRTLFEAPKIGKATQRADYDVVQTDNKITERNKIAQAMEEAVKANPEAEGQIRQQYQKRINEAAPTDEEVLGAYESLSVLPETEEKNAIRENLEGYMAEKGIQAEPTGMDAGLGELMRREPPVIQTVNAEFPVPVAEEAVAEELTPKEEDEALAAFGREVEGIEEAAPVAPAEEEVVTEEVPIEQVAPEVAPEVVSAAPVEEAAPITSAALPKELLGKTTISSTGFGGDREHTTGKVSLEDLKVLDVGIETARQTLETDKSFKPSKEPIVVGVDVNTGEKQLLDGYHRYLIKNGKGEVAAKFIPMRNGEIISFEEAKAPAAPALKGRKRAAPVTPAPAAPKKQEGISDVKVSEGKGGWRKSFNETQNITRKNSILEEVAGSSTNPNELRDAYEAAKQTEKETNRINYAIANNKNTPQDVFDDLINSKALERTTSDEAIQSIIDKRAEVKPTETKEGKKAEAKEEKVRPEIKEGFTEGPTLNKIYADVKSKYGDKKGASIMEVALRLVNPNQNAIIEVRSNGVVVKEGGKYLFKPFTDTDLNQNKWRLGKPLDISEQFAKPEAAPSFTSSQSSEAATAFDKAKTSKGFDKKYGKGAYKALSDITKNFEDIMDKVSEKIKQDCII